MTLAIIYFTDRQGRRTMLGEDSFSPLISTQDIRDLMTMRYWDSNLDSEGCTKDFEIFDNPDREDDL